MYVLYRVLGNCDPKVIGIDEDKEKLRLRFNKYIVQLMTTNKWDKYCGSMFLKDSYEQEYDPGPDGSCMSPIPQRLHIKEFIQFDEVRV